MRVIFPCKDCPDRTLGCHAACIAYKDAVHMNEIVRRKASEQREQARIDHNMAWRAYLGYAPIPYNKRKGDIGV